MYNVRMVFRPFLLNLLLLQFVGRLHALQLNLQTVVLRLQLLSLPELSLQCAQILLQLLTPAVSSQYSYTLMDVMIIRSTPSHLSALACR